MKYLYTLLLAALLFSGGVYIASAATPGLNCPNGVCTYSPLEPLPVANGAQSGRDFPTFVSGVFKVLLSFGGLFAVVMLVVAGIGYMLSESAVDIDRAKDRAKAALWGLVILMGSWLILNTINPDLLKFNLFNSALSSLSGVPQTPSVSSPASSAAPAGAQPSNTVGGGTVNNTVQNAVCGAASSCDMKQNYITYDFGASSPDVQAKVDAFKTNCEAPILDTQRNVNRVGTVKSFSGSLVGGSELTTGLACILN